MKTVQLDDCTHERLILAQAQLTLAVHRNPGQYPPWMVAGRLSMDDVISYMLDHREADLLRCRETRRRAADRKAAGIDPADEVWDNEDILSIPPGTSPPAG